MKKPFFVLAAAAAIALNAAATVDNLLPRPQRVEPREGALALSGGAKVTDPTNTPALARALEEAGLVPGTGGIPVTVTIGSVEGAYDYPLAAYPAEAYCLEVSPSGISITAPTQTGVIRASQTLAQLAEDAGGAIPAVTITDWPAFKLRGFMHDVGRSFIDIDELRNEIDLLSRFKVNTFHWHLTDYTGWRLEIAQYPQLTGDKSITRFPGKYYTREEARELEAYAAERGVTVIPEIDMPGHSHPFEQSMGFGMQSEQGKAALKNILREVCETFPLAPYIHIGGDEVSYPDSYIVEMLDYVHSLGRKAVIWNRYNRPAKLVNPSEIPADMVTNWATSGSLVSGIPNIDMRYNYTNHFDVFADVVGIYKSTIFNSDKGNSDIAGTISAAWNDTRTPTQTDIIRQNNIYANILASAERAWTGGGRRYIEAGGTTLPNDGDEYEAFADWERRFIHHKNGVLAGESIPYVKQSHEVWRVTEQMPNGGNPAAVLAPEQYIGKDEVPTSFEIDNNSYKATLATGAGIYLRHIWHGTVKGFYSNPQNNMTAYAWTYVYSPEEQDAGAFIEFYTYSRSGAEKAPDAGKWDRRGSRIWLNGSEIPAPEWAQPGKNIPQDHDTEGLSNENFTARPPVQIRLRKGWNQVFMKLPHANNGGTGRDKWQFTFAVTDTEGRDALDGLVYSPSKSMNGEPEEPKPNQPVDGLAYFLSTPNRGNRYATSKGAGNEIIGEAATSEAAQWRFVKRADSDWNIVNVADGSYVSPVADNNTALRTTTAVPDAGWGLLPSDDENCVIIVSGTTQWNQTNAGLGWKVYNWGYGSLTAGEYRTNDTGCQYVLTLVPGQESSISTVVSDGIVREGIYDLAGRRIDGAAAVAPGVYIVNGRKVMLR